MDKKRQIEIVESLIECIKSNWLKVKYRTKEEYFTRKRILTLELLIVLVIRGLRMPMQNAINKFFRQLGRVEHLPTASAYSQAREKFNGDAFVELNQVILKLFYREDADYEKLVRLWKGRRLLAIDCSMLNLPDTEELRRKYTVVRNGSKIERVQAQSSFLYDVLNDIALNALLGKQKAERDYIFDNHEEHIKEQTDITLFDMNYADYSVMAYFSLKNKYFIIRNRPTHTFRQVWEFASDAGKTDETITLKATYNQSSRVRQKHLPKEIKLRLIKIRLDENKDEILVTNLFDKDTAIEDFSDVYQKRWNQESYFDRIKNLFTIEKFSGFSDQIIKQDFYGTVFLSSLESILVKDTDIELKEKSADLKYEQKVNRSVSISAMIESTVDIFLNERKPMSDKLDELKVFLKKNPVTVRHNRHFERKDQSTAKILWYYKYQKKIIS